jgi:phosphotransferase system enzyme I (PtsP)
VVGRLKNLLHKVEPGDLIIVDGDNAQVMLRPSEDIQHAIEMGVQARALRKEVYARLRSLPSVTRDGTEVRLMLNAGLLIDLPQLDETGADGIGLYRTELQFMVRNTFPDVVAQADLYRRILDAAGARPVLFRTLDIGGDKLLPYLPEMEDENPAMGWRAIRIALDRPAMLRQQVRALIAAAPGRILNMMFPMVAEIAEFDAARAIVDIEWRRAAARGQKLPKKLQVGVMLEVPALIWQFPALLRRVDFVSVGSNDLIQFLFACDRGNSRLADRYDVLSPPVLKLLRQLVRDAEQGGTTLSICGEMAGRPLEAMALIGLGFRHLSMSPTAFGSVKAMVRSLEIAPLRAYVESLYDLGDHSVRERLRAFALDHGVAI